MKILNNIIFGFLICSVMYGMDNSVDPQEQRIRELEDERAAIVANSSKLDGQQTRDLVEIDKRIYNVKNGIVRLSGNQGDQ